MSSRRKFEATTHVDNDSTTHRHKGERGRKDEIKECPTGQSLKVGHGFKRGMGETKCAFARCAVENERTEIGSSKLIVCLRSLIRSH